MIDPATWRQMAQASLLATEFAIAAAGGAFGGRWLDGRLGTDPGLTLLGAALGLALGTWLVMRGMTAADRREGGPPT